MRRSGLIWNMGGMILPSSLSLTLSLRDYQGVVPWDSEASAGTSGSRDLEAPTGTPALDTLNGWGVVDFQEASSTSLQDSDETLATFFDATSFSGWALVYSDVAQARHVMFSSPAIGFKISLTSGTEAHFTINNDANSLVRRTFAHQTWQLITFRYDGVNTQIGVNEPPGAAGGTSTKAFGSSTTLTDTLILGRSNAQYFDGKIADVGLSDTVLADAHFNAIKTYCNWRYALSL